MSGQAPVDRFERARQLCQLLLEQRRGDAAVVAAELSQLLDELDIEDQQLHRQLDESVSLAGQLEHERRRYREFFDLAPEPSLITDPNGIVHECNERAAELLTVNKSTPLVLAVTPADRAAFHNFVNGLNRSGGRTTLRFDTRIGLVLMDIRCRGLGPNQLLWSLRDITEIEEARVHAAEVAERDRSLAQQLRALDEQRSAFLLAVTHDLRAPLAAIAGLADTIADQPQLSARDRQRAINHIRDTARRVVELFTDLLDLERLERRELAVHREDIDVADVICRAIEHVDLGARPLSVDVPSLRANADAVLIERITENLLRNAADHTPEATQVWLRCRQEPDGLLIVVEDNGPGIPAGMRPMVFELFQRGRHPGVSDGLGVGLTLVRRFAELHGGYARVYSRPAGGASFHVLLPDR